MITLSAFETKYYGDHVPNNHGAYPGECVSLAARWAQEGQGVADGDSALFCAHTGGARDLWEWYGKPGSNIQNFYDKATSPVEGDLVVWGSNMGQYGDVAIYIGSGQVFGQLGTPVFIPAAARQLTPQPLGYLRRRSMVPDQDHLNALFRAFRGRNANDDEIHLYVQKVTYDYMVEQLDVGPERADTKHALEVGQTAVKDDWQGQIYSLEAQLKTCQAGAAVLKPGTYKVN